jgi:hypothetical protein
MKRQIPLTALDLQRELPAGEPLRVGKFAILIPNFAPKRLLQRARRWRSVLAIRA